MKIKLPAKANFIAMWTWLGNNPWNKDGNRMNGKSDWPGCWTINRLNIHFPRNSHWGIYRCFACQIVPLGSNGESLDCSKCPVDFGEKDCLELGSIYDNWTYASSVASRAKFAKLISKAWKGPEFMIYGEVVERTKK